MARETESSEIPKPRIFVSPDGGGDFRSIQEAVDSAPETGACIRVAAGMYREKLFVDRPGIELEGEGRELTRVIWADSAEGRSPDGKALGTFRSYTAFFGGAGLSVKGMSFENAAGRGKGIGQGIAVYLDARDARFEDCAILGRQDSLFLGPLPPEPRIPGSFSGPGEARPREAKRHLFLDCLIAGDVDFIFGSSEALFFRCELRSLALPPGEEGFVTAASSPAGREGLCFVECRLGGSALPSSVFLGRPWRPSARVSFLRCELGSHIKAQGWADWEGGTERLSVRFSEGGSLGPGAGAAGRAPWARLLSEAETEAEARHALLRFGLAH